MHTRTRTDTHARTHTHAGLDNSAQHGQKYISSFSALPIIKDLNHGSQSYYHHFFSILHHCAYVFHWSRVYWSPIGRPLIAWRLPRKKEKKKKETGKKKSKQRNSFVNSLLLLAADLAQVVMPILLERTQTSYCHPSLTEAPWTQTFLWVCVKESVGPWGRAETYTLPARLCTHDRFFTSIRSGGKPNQRFVCLTGWWRVMFW